jgi:hypothetical protein
MDWLALVEYLPPCRMATLIMVYPLKECLTSTLVEGPPDDGVATF